MNEVHREKLIQTITANFSNSIYLEGTYEKIHYIKYHPTQ